MIDRDYLLTCLLATSMLWACSPQKGDEATSADPLTVPDGWAEALLEDRREKDEEFRTSATSPMAGVQYLKSDPGRRFYLIRKEDGLHLTVEPGATSLLRVVQEESTWRWYTESDAVTCRVGDEEQPSGSLLAGSATFAADGLTLGFYASQDRVTFIVYDPERDELQRFQHLYYYPPDPAYAVGARLERLSQPEEVILPTSRNLEKTFYRTARLHFEVEGVDLQLTAFSSELDGDGARAFFIPFRDRTTGADTYAAGRFLEIDEPEGDRFLLDFNRAFNPLCNYSPAFNCALPPQENHLPVSIRAGEKTYPH